MTPIAGLASREAVQWMNVTERHAEPGSLGNAWLNFAKGSRSCMRGNNAEGIPLIRKAAEQTRILVTNNYCTLPMVR